ncbi:hypothetical protein, variant [Verruconis gallopava]|uniref:HECT-type E3 ubiquitin transferase n=1 Tax=Verruconis gallopava TaxID=253628 RepID=A0A0D2AHQ8_9PEZI|nr:hypothetical protein, variant [Verruconis gallopava]KIW06428.1 hypothetical protein, variant [Verruconis gallopava]
MGKILKAAGERHEATLSPFVKEFTKTAISLPTRELQKHLNSFPSLWPFPRGDLYHWITVLNRFDTILERFNNCYGLNKGPQRVPFGTGSVIEEARTQEKTSSNAANEQAESIEDIDVELVKSILRFTILLLSNCGNRSLYASSDRLNDLLNTTDLTLLQLTLKLSLLLAKRYYSSKQRMSAVGGTVPLSQHYNINVERVRKLAAPFPSPAPPNRQPDTPSASAKGKDKRLSRSSRASLTTNPESKLNGSDIVAIVKNDGPQSLWKQWADVKFTFYPDKAWMSEYSTRTKDTLPETPTIRRTTTTPIARSSNERDVITHRRRSWGDDPDNKAMRVAIDIELPSSYITSHSVEDAVQTNIESHNLPDSSCFEFLHRLRIAKALVGGRDDRLTLVGIRLLAIANLAYIESEPTFYSEFARADSEQPRQLQVAFQLAELVQPASDESSTQVPLELQIIAVLTMDALTHQKFRANDVYSALNANVNHGILFYMVRKSVDQLRKEESTPNLVEEEWREALFALLSSLPTVMPRAGDLMMSAGLLEILLEILSLRTKQAERTHWKALTFLDTFVYSVRDGYQTFANAKGLDIVKDLTAFIVSSSFEHVEAGHGIPEEYRAPITDYRIPFFEQSTLRWLFKFINHLMAHNNANFGRQMRNLIDSPEMLESLRKVMSHANIYGSNVWAGAVSIWTTFINNEPTSFSVIAESKLGECFLEALMDPPQHDGLRESGVDFGLLPVSEAINAVPQAFQALCLNEAGLKLIVDSGALPRFFKVFTSPLHVKALDQDRELAQALGGAFDELCRHQPTLRKAISDAVRGMVAQVAKLCSERATKDGFGAKLWVGNDEGQLYVAGGHQALAGISPGSAHASGHISMDEVIASREPNKLPYPTAYIGATTRFLNGYLANSTMCSMFIQDGGIENALDLATSPCLPFSFEAMNCAYLHDDLGRMLSILSESKVFILLPALTRRLQKVLSGLDEFLDYNDPSCGFFAPFTNIDRKFGSDDLDDPRFAAGTIFVKALVTVNVLCNALCYIFANTSMYPHRPSNNVFLQVNLTDVWVNIIEKMGKLQRSLTWEEILLASNMPASWINKTQMPNTMIEHDSVTDQILRFHGDQGTPGTSDASTNEQAADDDQKPGTAQFENTRVLRHLFYQAPFEISHFFNAMGKMLLVRRPDTMQRQNATLIAEQLAKSQTEALNFRLPQDHGDIKRLHEYWTVTLTRVSSLMIDDSYERTSPQTLTLVLKCFKEQDGFAALERALESFITDCKKLAVIETTDPQQLRDLANTMAGIKLVLAFYSRVINAKLVQDALQTQALTGRSSDSNGSDFSFSQFLVEIRYAVIKPAMRLWDESESAFMDKAITPVVRNLIDILRIELEAEGESKALTRKDKAPVRKQIEHRKWTPKNKHELDELSREYSEALAIEALYRCYDNSDNAEEYLEYVRRLGRTEPLFPVPSGVIAAPSRSQSSPRRPGSSTLGDSESQSALPQERTDAASSMLLDGDHADDDDDDDEGDDNSSPPRLPALQMNANVLREMMMGSGQAGEDDQHGERLLRTLFGGGGLDSPQEALQSSAQRDDNRPLAGKVPDLITVDDLNEERVKLRTNLIERCLVILSVHDDVTFELAELIFASVNKGSTAKESRSEIANLLLLSLTSLKMDEAACEEEMKLNNKKVACYAHLFALVLAKDEFYSVIEPELVANFTELVQFITTESVSHGPSAVANVLLILERLLSSDATPQQIEYNLPNPDSDIIEKHPLVELKPPLVPFDSKQRLFDALLKILLFVGKNETLALSVLRIFVILTRNRNIAAQLGEKQNIGRLFLMARQLQGMTDEKIQGSFLITLRHIIEDEDTLKNIMRNEIVASWSNRPHARPFDTTSYIRHFSHMAIRSPEIFVKATNDKVAINNYNVRQAAQTLVLKEDPAAQAHVTASSSAEVDASKSTEEERLSEEKLESEQTKSNELKMPVVENPDGVIHFILSELLKYKEVEDAEPTVEKAERKEEQTAPDVEMVNSTNPSTSSTPTPGETPSNKETKKDEKPVFKAENHPVYIYRCFLLQCLTELLSSYNRTKIEFINFKRKADPPGTTPSKPRSQVLNYLLHDLIPTGTLGHSEDINAKKREKTSAWAMSVIVALCSKTGEGGFSRPADFATYKEEPELLFVRKFVLEHAIKSYRDAMNNDTEGLEQRYSRLLSLADLFNRMLTGKPNGSNGNSNIDLDMLVVSQRMLAKIMYEKNFISALTSSISEIDLNFPNAKRAVKYILKPLKLLTQTAIDLSLHSELPLTPGSADEEISSDSEVSTDEDVREQTPDLFRNSALGILEPSRDEVSDEDDEDEDEDDEEMYADEYGDEMEYEEEMPHDHDEVVSDEEAELADMGPIEGLPGDVPVGMEIVGMEVEDEDDSEDSSEDTDDEDEEDDEDVEDEMDDGDEEMDMEEDESIEADDDDWESQPEDEDGEDYPIQDEGAHDFQDDPRNMSAALDEIVRALEGGGEERDDLLQRLDDYDGDLGEDHEVIDGDMQEEEEDDDDDEEEDFDEEEFAFEPDVDDDDDFEMGRGVPWGWEDGERGPGHRHNHHHHLHGNTHGHRHSPWGLFSDYRDRIFPPTSAYRSHRAADAQRRNDDGTNPLLQRSGAHGTPARATQGDIIGLPGGLGRFEISANGNPASFLNSLITAMSAGTVLPGAIHHRGGTLHVQINNAGLGPMPRDLEQLFMRTPPPGRRSGDMSRSSRDDPSSAILFNPALTMSRWVEESRILFGISAQDKALRVVNSILRLLVPPAIEEKKRKDKEEAERQKKREELERARKEKEEQERKEREEEEARKKEEEERKVAEAEAAARAAESSSQDGQMEGVEPTAPEPEASSAPNENTANQTARITTMIAGREIDITDLGIDPEYLAALPEELRQEVIMERTIAQRQSAQETGGEQQELDPEFLQALPPVMREEIMQQLALERRRNEREAERRQHARPDDIDAATFFATLEPSLRNQLLMEADDEALSALPPQLQAEARQLSGHHRRLDQYVDVNNIGRGDFAARGGRPGEDPAQKRKPTMYAQILDKAGVATLLRLMFIQQSGSIRNSLNGILRDICHNKQNRAEVVSILLSILQDGSNDINAVERSFSLLSLRAKQPLPSAQRTPQPKRSSSELGTGIGEMSPITVVQQCLVCLEALVQTNPRIAEFFLTEHETGTGFKPRSARKGKGKDSKSSRYPINALLGLLDREIIIESVPVMELLASLLQRITHPLLALLRKERQEKEKAADNKKDDSHDEVTGQGTEATPPPAASGDVEMALPEAPTVSAPEGLEPRPEGSVDQKDANTAIESSEDKTKKRILTPPDVPEYNLRLIINIIAARECPSKTFKDTLSLITNLSTIPEAKEIFGQELIDQALSLGRNILDDLQELEGQIRKAANGADVQGMALAKFSPASSDQAKLLRVITALDFLFDPKRAETQDKPSTSDAQSLGRQQKEDILTTLYENRIFVDLWDKLSVCLKEIHERENMFSVANILLPLIEVLMVVCKNTTLKDAPIRNTQQDFSLSSPEPESKEQRMESLFFRFTEDHRKILNELVRHNPKLMSGSFSLLVKNSKVLEFDNKRNYFTRRLHMRGQEVRQPQPSLQLHVRRDQVFLDSFKHLCYRKPEEIKYGKLNIRFAGEEGVDAGGVTREWFQAITKQMFDPNYALFVPVAADRTTFHPNPASSINEQHLTFFKFIGRIIGKALYEGRVLDCHFSRAVYKRILGRTISIKDMESLDNDYAKNLQWILDNDITDLITETFSVSADVFGEEKIVDLIPNGRNIEVTEENKHDYVQRVVEYKLIGSVKEQMEHFLQGFHDIVPADLVSIFNEQELELLISGLPDIDVEDWRNNTEYHNYTASSPQVQWFWRAVRSFDKEERAKLLQFVTGTSKVPLNGFKELEGMNGFSRFNIHRDYGNKDRLPSSHTCFNQLDLPEYDSYEDLRKALYTAITTGSEYFGFA